MIISVQVPLTAGGLFSTIRKSCDNLYFELHDNCERSQLSVMLESPNATQ